MKPVKFFLIISILFCVFTQETVAQYPYKSSIGGSMFVNVIGPTFKCFFSDNIAFQSDIYWKVIVSPYKANDNWDPAIQPVVEADANLMYQKRLKYLHNAELFYFVGGGINGGYSGCTKLGINTIFGLEFVSLRKPIAFQLDLRPGYGILIKSNDNDNVGFFLPEFERQWSFFDWVFGCTIRYTFKRK
ncbi:MAG: hypothetical protein LBP67_06080 [Bacteroidales bacterium]|jgi:hypothetical protein|nr:hypothetical protein [Bacteroidales bacterium]